MPTFDVGEEQVNLFNFGDIYLFKQYFNQDQLFKELKKYYNSDKYGFEVSEEDISEASQLLEEFSYEPGIVHEIDGYCVAMEKSAEADLFKSTVLTQRQSNYEVSVMKDELSVKQAVEKGAKPEKKGLTQVRLNGKSGDCAGIISYCNGKYKWLPDRDTK